jgi:hypothetical protein
LQTRIVWVVVPLRQLIQNQENHKTTLPTRQQENRVNPTISRVSDRDVPNSHIKQTRQYVQKSTVDRESKVTPTKHRDLKLNFEDFQQIDEHARKEKK